MTTARTGGHGGGDVLDPADMFRALAEAGVDYVLIGGFAVGAHGAGRATRDVDICPEPSVANLDRLAGLLDAIEAENVDSGEFGERELPPHDLKGLQRGGNFRLRTRLGDLDVMQYVSPFEEQTWEVLNRHAEERLAFGCRIRVCGVEDLLAMKKAAGRDQDLVDIENVKAARRDL